MTCDDLTCCLCDCGKMETSYHLFTERAWTTTLQGDFSNWCRMEIQQNEAESSLYQLGKKYWTK